MTYFTSTFLYTIDPQFTWLLVYYSKKIVVIALIWRLNKNFLREQIPWLPDEPRERTNLAIRILVLTRYSNLS